jgi:hypothetical protein
MAFISKEFRSSGVAGVQKFRRTPDGVFRGTTPLSTRGERILNSGTPATPELLLS